MSELVSLFDVRYYNMINKMKNNTKFYKKFSTKAHLIVTIFRERNNKKKQKMA